MPGLLVDHLDDKSRQITHLLVLIRMAMEVKDSQLAQASNSRGMLTGVSREEVTDILDQISVLRCQSLTVNNRLVSES